MSNEPSWRFVGSTPDGLAFEIDGVDVWKHKWTDTKERVQVQDPHYHRSFTFDVYEIRSGDKVLTFAAGEFSNCIWGFFVRK